MALMYVPIEGMVCGLVAINSLMTRGVICERLGILFEMRNCGWLG